MALGSPSDERHVLPIARLIDASFKDNYKKVYEENTNTLDPSNISIDLSANDVDPLKFVLPIKLTCAKNQDRELYNALKIYCQSEEYQMYGSSWPTEAADSLSLDSLLDWDFDNDEKDIQPNSPYTPNELLVVTEKTIYINGCDDRFHFEKATILDAIIIPHHDNLEQNDTCLLALDSGDIYSMHFAHDAKLDSSIIEPVCIWRSSSCISNFNARFIISKDNTIGLVTNLSLINIIKLHRKEPVFFKVEYNILLKPDFLFHTVNWYGSTLAYLNKGNNSIHLIKYNSNRAKSIVDYKLPNDDINNSADNFFLLDDDKFLSVNQETEKSHLHIAQEEKETIQYLDITLFVQLYPHLNADLEQLIDKRLSASHLLVLSKHIVLILAITPENHIVAAFLTKLSITIDAASISHFTADAYLHLIVDSTKEIHEYKIDISDIKFHPIQNFALQSIPLLHNITNERFILEGYQPILKTFHHTDSIYLQSESKLYRINRKPEHLRHLQQLSWLPNFHIFDDIKLIDLHQQPITKSHIGPIRIDKSSDSHQFIIIGISTSAKNEAFYLELHKNRLTTFSSIDHLLPTEHIPAKQFFLAAFLHSFFILVTPNLIYLNNFHDKIELPSSFKIQNCLLLPNSHSTCPTILLWNVSHLQLLSFPDNSSSTKETPIHLPPDNYCNVFIYHNSSIIVASTTKYYIYDLASMKNVAQFTLSQPFINTTHSTLMQSADPDRPLTVFSPTSPPFQSLLQISLSTCLHYSPGSIHLHNSIKNHSLRLTMPLSSNISSSNSLLSIAAATPVAATSFSTSSGARQAFFFLLYDTGLCIAKLLPAPPKSGFSLPFQPLIPLLPSGFLNSDASLFYQLSSSRVLSTSVSLSLTAPSTILSASLVATNLHAIFSYHSLSHSIFISLLRLKNSGDCVLFELSRIQTIKFPAGSIPIPVLEANSGVFHVFNVDGTFFVYALVRTPAVPATEQWSCVEWCKTDEKVVPGLIPMVPFKPT